MEGSQFLSTVNQLSISTITIPECKEAKEGEGITRHTFEMWRDLLVDYMKLAGVVDEATQYTIFKVKAGLQLLQIFRNTKSSQDSPDPDLHPFANAMQRLQTYFATSSNIMLQRRKLAITFQNPGESDIDFVTRVGAIIRLCDFEDDKQFSEMIGIVAGHASNPDVRKIAFKMIGRGGSITELVDKIRELDAMRMNEEFFNLKHDARKQALVAPVFTPKKFTEQKYWQSSQSDEQGNRFGRRPSFRGNQVWKQRNQFKDVRCKNCNRINHDPSVCPASNDQCRRCKEYGHWQRVCPKRYDGGFKRPSLKQYQQQPSKRLATIEKSEEKADTEENVGIDN